MNLLVKTLVVIGSLTCGFIATLAAIFIYRTDLIDRILPEPLPARPVAVAIYGPSIAVKGDRVYFQAAVTGEGGVPVWRIFPESGAGSLRVVDNGRGAEFSSMEEGVFSIMVAVGGEGKQVASDFVEFENLSLAEEKPADPPPAAMAQQAPVMPEHIPTVAEVAGKAMSEVASDNRAGEARIVGGCFRSLVNRLQTGLVAPDADVMLEISEQVNTALGDRAAGWGSFLAVTHGILESLKDQGAITTAASAEPTLNEISGVLLNAR